MAERRASATCGPPAAPIPSSTPPGRLPLGGSKVLRSSPDDAVTLIGAGVTLHACLAAADRLAGDGIRARVIDLYSVKPFHADTLAAAAAVTSGRLVVAEDHHRRRAGLRRWRMPCWTRGRRRFAFRVICAVREMPGSGTSKELLAGGRVRRPRHIAAAARDLLLGGAPRRGGKWRKRLRPVACERQWYRLSGRLTATASASLRAASGVRSRAG